MNIPPELAAFISSSPDDLLKQWSNYENSVIDYCSYYIYCDNINHILSSHVIDTYESVKLYIDDKIKDYLWHKHKFNLQIIVPSNDSSGSSNDKSPIYFHGLVKYGDNIEDEWYIVYILIETSKKFPGLSIKVVDADGEFILIEAADYLPKWIGPENSENRVWIRNGLINIISPEDVGSSNHSGIKISQAITALQRSNTKLSTCADDRVQSCIRNRTINVYPGKAKASEFTTICYLPTNVASLLQTHPDLITIAVESFCSSDKNNVKYVASMSLFERDLKLDEMVIVPIRFTRGLYALMTFKEFHPPKKFHKVMYSINSSNPPDSETLRLVKKAFDIGTRLTVGLEIAYQKSRVDTISNKSNITTRYNANDFMKAIKSSNRMQVPDDPNAVNRLKEKYSNGDIIMSKKNDYNKVCQLFDEDSNGLDYFNEDYTDPFVMNPISTIIGNHLAKRASDPSLYTLKYAKLTEGDSDDWLYLSPEDFEKEMNERIKNIGATVFKTDADVAADTKPDLSNNDDDDVKEHIDQLNGVVKGVKEFMNMKSTIDGIEIDSDDDDDDDNNDKDDDSDNNNDNNKDGMFTGIDNINFNDIMEQLLKISSGESNIKNVNLNEYFSSDDDDDDDDVDSNVDKKNNNKNDKSNNDKKNNPSETLHGIKNIILSNDDSDDNVNDNVNDKDSDDEDSFYNDSENSDEDRNGDDDTDDDSDRDNLSENNHDDFMSEYSKYMEAELSSTTLAESFEKSENNSNNVDVEKNLLKYLMESHASQLGMPGPTTQLLSQLNLSLPLPPPMNTKDV